MTYRFLLVSLLVLGLAQALPAAGPETEKLILTVPKGDPEAGRKAFLALGCVKCHAAHGVAGLPEPVITGTPVPVLGPAQAKEKPGALASSIIAPSHRISQEVSSQTEGELSPMGDFSHAMTVRQLLDLVAFIRSLDD